MLELNKSHPGFDMTMEVKCLLPALPVRVDMKHICHDLGITRRDLNMHLERIIQHFRIDYQPGVSDMAVGVPAASWAALQIVTQEYFDTLYG